MPDRTPQKKFRTSDPAKLYTDAEAPELVEIPELVILEPGTIIDGKYKVLSCIGTGEIAITYKVEHLTKQREFALKLFANEYSESQIQRFQSDAKAASMLEHPNTAKLVDFGVLAGKQPYYVSELLSGISLADYLERCGRLTYDDIFAVFLSLSWALQDAHEKGVVHRNVKPSNILLIGEQGNWECKLLDFGTGKLSDGCRKSKGGYIRASVDPRYMSPEQCSGKKLDGRSDIYSLGCALFEAITAQPPYCDETSEAIKKMHLNDPLPTLKEASLGREFPQLLEGIVHTMLAKEPQHRYSSAGQVAESLMRLKLSAQLKIKVQPKIQPVRHSQDKIIAILCFTSIIAIGLAIFFWLQLNHPLGIEKLRASETIMNREASFDRLTVEDMRSVPPAENVKLYAPNKSKTPFFKKSRTVDGIEFREYLFTAEKLGTLRDPKSVMIEASGTQEVAWSGPWVFQTADAVFQICPYVLKRFRSDEIRAIDFVRNVDTSKPPLHELQRYKKLDELSFHASRFNDSDLKEILRLRNLKTLSLRGTQATAAGLSGNAGLGQLRKLALEGMPDTILVLDALKKSKNLEELQLRYCPGLTEEHYKAIAAIPNLKRLSILRRSGIDPALAATLANSKTLEELDTGNTKLLESDIQALAPLYNIGTLKTLATEGNVMDRKARVLMKQLLPGIHWEQYIDYQAYWNGY